MGVATLKCGGFSGKNMEGEVKERKRGRRRSPYMPWQTRENLAEKAS